MNEHDRVGEIIAELETISDRDRANVVLYQYGGGSDESAVKATPDGYRLFAAALLKASLREPGGSISCEDAGLSETWDENSDYFFDFFAVKGPEPEEEPAEPSRETFGDKLFVFLIGTALFSIPLFWLIGFASSMAWLYRTIF